MYVLCILDAGFIKCLSNYHGANVSVYLHSDRAEVFPTQWLHLLVNVEGLGLGGRTCFP